METSFIGTFSSLECSLKTDLGLLKIIVMWFVDFRMFSTHLYTNTPRHKTEISRTFILSSTVACVFVYVRTRSNGYTFSTDCEKVQLISRSTLPYQIATVEYSHENAFVSLSFPESSKSSSILQNNRLVSDNRIS